MADQFKYDHSYGHLGELTYDEDTKIWQARRTLRGVYVYKPLGHSRLVLAPSAGQQGRDRDGDLQEDKAKRRSRQIQDVAKRFPDIQPASKLLSPLLRVSEAVNAALTRYEPNRGHLLASGRIPSHVQHTSVRVVALPHGPTGGDLVISRIRNQRRGWDDSRHVYIKVPTIHGEQMIWRGSGAPIQQICFANATNGSDTLAVRLVEETLIFIPTFQPSTTDLTPMSRIEPVSRISTKQTGSLKHADVSINPWYPRQFGIVDSGGNWTIWEPGGHGRTSRMVRVCGGSLNEESGDDALGINDGWARLVWAGGPSIIAVCTRSRLALFDISHPEAKPFFDDSMKSSAVLRDLVRPQAAQRYLCVLTSTHVLVYDLEAGGIDVANINLVLSSRHFRNPEDSSLKLQAFADGRDAVLLIYSNWSSIVTQHRIRIQSPGDIAFSDASNFDFQDGMRGTPLRVPCLGMQFLDAAFGGRAYGIGSSTKAAEYRDNDIHFRTLLTLQDDMSLSHQLYAAVGDNRGLRAVSEPSWESKVKTASEAVIIKRRFVVDDAHMTSSDEDHYRRRPASCFMRRYHRRHVTQPDLSVTVNYIALSQQILGPRPQSARALAEALDMVEGLLQRNRHTEVQPLQTMLEYSGERTITDLELASSRLQTLSLVQPVEEQETQRTDDDEDVHEPTQSLRLVLRFLHTPSAASLPGDATLERVYEHMVADWVSPLSPQVPGSIRLGKEQLVRRLAPEIALASRVLRLENNVQTSEDSQRSLNAAGLAGKDPSASVLVDFSGQPQASSQSVLPTPSPTATPSVTTLSSHPSSFTAPQISRLSQYTTFSKPPSTSMPRSLSRVLAHWEPGADLDAYDWITISRQISQREDEDLDSQALTEKERARLQRRAERHIRRQRREAAASQASQLASSQAIHVLSTSQPAQQAQAESQPSRTAAGIGVNLPSSQSQGFGAAAASQVVPGRYGGRPPVKKKRKHGF